MKMKALGVAVAVALASTSAFAAQEFADTTGRGSLLIFPRIDISDGNNTLITIVNDYDGMKDVWIKCFYVVPGKTYKDVKLVKDFAFKMTHNHPTYFWAREGGNGAPPFSPFPGNGGPAVPVSKGELKCWAVDVTDDSEIHFNFLSGTASIINDNGQASEYSAYAFQAVEGGTGKANAFNKLSSPGTLNLDNREYEQCASQLLGSFLPGDYDQSPKETASDASFYKFGHNKTQITIAGCIEDLRQDRSPVYTKLNYTFWNQYEEPRTGNWECMDSWYETDLDRIYDATYDSLGTKVAYFRVFAAPSTWCGSTSAQVTPGIIGVKQEWNRSWFRLADQSLKESTINMRGTHLTGRGNLPGVVKTDLANTNGAQ